MQSHISQQPGAFENSLKQRAELHAETAKFVAEHDADRTQKFESAASAHRYKANLAMQQN